MSTTPPDGKPPRLDEILGRLPETPALGPMVDRLIGSSLPDPSRSWAASEELGTTGGRLVDLQAVEASVGELVEAEAQRLGRQFGRVAALARAFSTGAFGAAIHVLLEESGDLEAAGRAGEAGAWADAAVRIGLEIGAPRTAEALRRLARCARAEGRLSEAASGYEEAFRRARDLGRTEDAVVAATGRGNVAVDRGRWSVAERWYHRALGLLDAAEPDGDTATLDEPRDHVSRARRSRRLGHLVRAGGVGVRWTGRRRGAHRGPERDRAARTGAWGRAQCRGPVPARPRGARRAPGGSRPGPCGREREPGSGAAPPGEKSGGRGRGSGRGSGGAPRRIPGPTAGGLPPSGTCRARPRGGRRVRFPRSGAGAGAYPRPSGARRGIDARGVRRAPKRHGRDRGCRRSTRTSETDPAGARRAAAGIDGEAR